MNASNAAWPTPRLEQQFDRFNEGADLAGRNFERLLATQFDGYRDWVAALNVRSAPAERLEQHLDQSVQLGCSLFVAQISAMTDAMQLLEKSVAEQQRNMLASLDAQPATLGQPLKQAVCVSACAFDSLSKASRQVANFASNRFAAATKSALQQARDKLSENS